MRSKPVARLLLVALLVLSLGASCYLAYPAWRERRENERLKAELLHQQQRTRVLRGLVDTLQAAPRRLVASPPVIQI